MDRDKEEDDRSDEDEDEKEEEEDVEEYVRGRYVCRRVGRDINWTSAG